MRRILYDGIGKEMVIMEEVVLFHTNDLHSHLENWPKIRRYILEKRASYLAASKTVITLDLGDFIDRWHPLSEVSHGQRNIQLMNSLHYDAVTIGNNEGVGNSKKQLNQLYQKANFDVVLDNLLDQDTGAAPLWAKPYKIIETKEHKIGLIALTAPFPLTYHPNGWDILTTEQVLPKLINEVREKVDILVLMSHLGIDEDLKIANTYPDIDVLLGSHTHHLFPNGEKVNRMQLAAAGKFGMYIGEVHLTLNQGQIVSSFAETISTAALPEEVEDQKEIVAYIEEGQRLLKANKVACIPWGLSRELKQEHSFMEVALAALKQRGETDVAILNNGLFMADIPAGIVDENQLHQSLPHPMHLIKVTLNGADLIRLAREMEKNRHFLRKFPIVGMGFRGKVFGELRYSGLKYEKRTQQVYWLGQLVDEKANYTLTTVDHFMFIPFFPTIELAGKVEFIFPEFIRTVIGDYLKRYYPIISKQGIINK